MNKSKGQVKDESQINPTPVTQPTDMYIQPFLKTLIPELNGLESLKDMERRIDVYLSRKKIDLHQSVTQWTHKKYIDHKDHQYLRVFISNISENQPWQTKSNNIDQGTWTLRIEGRLVNDESVDNPSRLKFSHFLQSIAVDFYPVNTEHTVKYENGNSKLTNKIGNSQEINGILEASLLKPQASTMDIVEWHFDSDSPVEFDGLDIKRQGSENIKCTITIQPRGSTGDELQYSSSLVSVIGISKGNIHEAIYSLYKYILLNNLLTNDETNTSDSNGEKTVVKVDSSLASLLPREKSNKKILKLIELPQLINHHIKPIPPIKLDYIVRVDKASTYGDLVFDLEVPNKLLMKPSQQNQINPLVQEGMNLLSEFNTLTTQLDPQIQALEKRSQLLQLQLNSSANKYQFFHKLSDDPVLMLQDYMKSTSQALKVLSGDDGFNEDTVRRSKFYQENEAMLFENISVLLSNGRM